jgi:hypothetical protein
MLHVAHVVEEEPNHGEVPALKSGVLMRGLLGQSFGQSFDLRATLLATVLEIRKELFSGECPLGPFALRVQLGKPKGRWRGEILIRIREIKIQKEEAVLGPVPELPPLLAGLS